MSFDALDALRQAGILEPGATPVLEELFSGLSPEETRILIAAKGRIRTALPDVEAHSQDWAAPEATSEGFNAAMLCACGAWSGSGSSAN
jgi:2-methylcitrate dehydratase PrpD